MGRPKKREIEEKHLTRLVTELIRENPSLSDIGIIIGCLEGKSVKELEELKKNCTSIDEFLEIARQRADIALVVAATKAALGYDYEESEQIFRRIPRTGAKGTVVIDEVPAEKKVKHRHAKKNDALLKFLLRNRLPEYFSDTKRIEINKKVIEIKGNTEKEIRSFAGRLLEVIDSEFVETKK